MKIPTIIKEHWGWIIAVASFWTFFFSFSVLNTYGLLYVELKEAFGSSNTETAWIGNLGIAMTGFGSLISSGLMQKYSHRPVAITGVIMLSVGVITTSVMPTLPPIFFTYGILVGLSCNFILISSITLLVKYFPERNASRSTAFALTGTTCGIVAMNPAANLMIAHWGWRNMLRVMGGTVLLIGLPCVSTFTEPHIDRSDEKKTSKNYHLVSTLTEPEIDSSDETKTPTCTNYHLVSTLTEPHIDNSDDKTPTKYRLVKDMATSNFCNRPHESKTAGDRTEVGYGDDQLRDDEFSINHRRTFREQLEILTFPELWFFTIARVIASTAQSFYYVNFVHFMMLMNDFEKWDAALVMTTVAVAEVVGKLLLSLTGDQFPFPRLYLFNIASLMGICVMGFLFAVERLWHMYCLAIATGLLMSVFDTMSFSVAVEVFGAERNSEVTSVLMIGLGAGSLLGALFGMSVDKSGTYDVAIYACIGIYCAAIILYTSVPIYQKLFARHRYIMNNSRNDLKKCRKIKTHQQLQEKHVDQRIIDRTTYKFERATSL